MMTHAAEPRAYSGRNPHTAEAPALTAQRDKASATSPVGS
jgi:hypothetical protein